MVRPALRKFFFINLTIVAVIVVLVLAGWQFDVEFLKHPINGLVAMNPITAISFLLAVAALYFFDRSMANKRLLKFSRFFALVILLSGALKIVHVAFGLDTGYDTFLFRQQLQQDIINGFVNTMSFYTAASFVVLGIAILCLSNSNRRRIVLAHALSLILMFLAILVLITYIYDPAGFSVASIIPMAWHTAVCFILLAVSTLSVHAEAGFMGDLTAPYKGSVAARMILPAAIIVPVLLGVLRLKAEEMGWVTTYTGTALFTLGTIIIFILFIWKGAASMNTWNVSMLTEMEVRKKSEEDTKAANIFLDSILENIPSLVFVKEPNNLRFIRINRETERVLGISREDAIGKNDFDLFPHHQAEIFTNKDREVMAGRKVVEIPEEMVTTFNGDRWLRKRKIPVYDKDGKPLYLIGISEDITSAKQDKDRIHNFYQDLELKVQERTEALSKSETRFRVLIENAVDVILMTDADGRITYQSPAVEKITGFKPGDKIGEEGVEFVHPLEKETMRSTITKLRSTPGETKNFSSRTQHKDGHYIWIEGSMTNLLDEPGINAIVFNYHDITERRLAEDRLKKYYEELKRSNNELEQFAYIASHDLQEPLRMVSSFLQLLEKRYENLLDETAKKYIHFALDGSERMKTLILDLLAYSRVGAGKEVFADVDIHKIVVELKLMFEPELNKTGGEIIVSQLPVLRAIKSQMVQLFQNLISNALKYRREAVPAVVKITCSEQERHWLFTVEDNGIGIEQKFFDKLFVLFQRLHDKKTYSGTGIGLAICKKIVEAHGGIIWVESEVGKGSRFYLMLKKDK